MFPHLILMSLRSFFLPKFSTLVARIAVLAGIFPILGWLFGGKHWLLDLFNHFQVQFAGALLLALLVLLCMKSWRLAGLVAVFFAVPVIRIAPLFIKPKPVIIETSLRFATFNVLTSNNRYDDAVKWIRETNPDVIFLPEVNEVWGEVLSPLQDSYPHFIDHPVEGNFGFAFYSKLPILSQEIISCGQLELPLLKARLKGPAGEFVFLGAHPVPPATAFWAEERDIFLQRIAEEVKKETLPVLLAGDLNATRWSHGMKPLFKVGLADSAAGFGIGATWQRSNPLVAIPIDHILFRNPAGPAWCSSHRVGPDLGSDHRPVVAEIAW